MTLYKCTDCEMVAEEVQWLDDNTPASDCCTAPVDQITPLHGDDCTCRTCNQELQNYAA